ncbi:hypothetical protein F4780DRAFT_777274 [Xylariomycetidae sp. FL0641]|nr:hypothetical protein F4780DRAFT_777274 [Xylariomycetidae sp. FL0641]
MDSFRLEDQKLLELDEHSDVIVTCGDRSWNLHRAIIASRCEYFGKVLKEMDANKAENQEHSVIQLEGYTEDATEDLIFWLYTKQLPNSAFAHHATVFTACAELYQVAVGLDLPDLQRQCLDELDDSLEYLQRNQVLVDGDEDGEFPQADLTGFFDGVRYAYKHNLRSIKGSYLDFMIETKCSIMKNQEFDANLELAVRLDTLHPGKGSEVLRFGLDILRGLKGLPSALEERTGR